MVEDFIKVDGQYYIRAASSLADEQRRVLKHSDTFAIFDRHGDIRPLGFEDHGIFHDGTRFLSRLKLLMAGKSPLLLSSSVKEDNDFLVVDLTNPDIERDHDLQIPRGTVHLSRTMSLWEGASYERLTVTNFGLRPVALDLALEVDADYADIFEVRGVHRARRGTCLPPQPHRRGVTLQYKGLDGRLRRTVVASDPAPDAVRNGALHYRVALDPRAHVTIEITIRFLYGKAIPKPLSVDESIRRTRRNYEDPKHNACRIETSNEQFNDWLNQSRADLHMLVTATDHGLYPYAGIPWFSTIFGRDGIITALQTLWLYPDIARGVLSYLAHTQAKRVVPYQDAEPGKILHEQRRGEMAALREIPFGRYYGTIDATPLFVILAGRYYARSGDLNFIERLWPHIEAALTWIDTYGDRDGDGFVEYAPRADGGLRNQGWKDSDDAVFHADGTLAEPPIALCEVQGYVYEARVAAATLAAALGKSDLPARLNQQAAALRERFLDAFWCPELGLYALALDGQKAPCRVRSSNAGHCLFAGIATPEHAAQIARQFMGHTFFGGWGVRTVASSETRYNPMSYHNGSVWPHDNALMAAGFARYQLKEAAVQLMTGLFDASLFLQLHRLPELFCGFARRRGEGPTLYPVACDPQAWAAGAVFMLLQACLGLDIRADENKLCFTNPTLPPYLDAVHIHNLEAGSSRLDLSLQRHPTDVAINVRRKEGDIDVVVLK